MTDRDKLTALLTEWGVPFTDGEDGVTVGGWEQHRDSGKIVGYSGFYTLFEFTPDGTFTTMGAWE
jgi:hypothetical protein